MCIEANFTKPTITTEPITAYKVVRRRAGETFRSNYLPGNRRHMRSFETHGKDRQYVVGKKSQSTFRSTPGLFCYKYLDVARCAAGGDHALLQVRIPAGTKIVEGTTQYYQAVICCERLVVEEALSPGFSTSATASTAA